MMPPKSQEPPIVDVELPSETFYTDASRLPPESPPPIIDIELPGEESKEIYASSEEQEKSSDDLPFYIDEDEVEDDLDAAIASVKETPSKVGIRPDNPLSMGTESSSFINSGSSVQSKPARYSTVFRPSSGSDMSFEPRQDLEAPKKRRIVKMAEKTEPPPSTFRASGGSDLSFEAKTEMEGPKKRRMVKMAEKKEPAPSTFARTGSGMSFEAKTELEGPKKQRIVKMAEKKAPAPSTFTRTDSGMSFEAKLEALTSKRIAQMKAQQQQPSSATQSTLFQARKSTAEKAAPASTMFKIAATAPKKAETSNSMFRSVKSVAQTATPSTTMFSSRSAQAPPKPDPEPLVVPVVQEEEATTVQSTASEEIEPTSTFESKGSEMSFETNPEVIQEEPAPSTFQKSDSGMSYEARPLEPPKKMVVRMTENAPVRPSTFAAGPNGQMFDVSATTKKVPASKSSMFTSAPVKETPLPQASMFKASAVQKESPPPQATMFQASAVKKDAPPKDTGMFKASTVKKESPPPQQTMFQATSVEKTSPPPLATPASSETQAIPPPKEEQQQKQEPPKVVAKSTETTEKPPQRTSTMFTSKKSDSDMSFEVGPSVPQALPKQRIVKMAEKKEPHPSTFRNDENGMMFEAAVTKKQSAVPKSSMFKPAVVKTAPTPTQTIEDQIDPALPPKDAEPEIVPDEPKATVVRSEDTVISTDATQTSSPAPKQEQPDIVPDEPKASVIRSEDTGISITTRQESPTKQRIVRMVEKKEPAPSTFQSSGTGMSFEPKIETQNGDAPRKRVVKMAEKKEAPTSKVFTSDDNGMMFVARKQAPSKKESSGSMFGAVADSFSAKEPASVPKKAETMSSVIATMFRPRTVMSYQEEELRLAEEAREKEKARVEEKMRLAEEARVAEEARLAEEEAKLAEKARIEEEAKIAEAAELQAAEELRIAEENRLSEEKEKERLDAWMAEEEEELEEMGRMVEERRAKEETTELAEDARKELAEEAAEIVAELTEEEDMETEEIDDILDGQPTLETEIASDLEEAKEASQNEATVDVVKPVIIKSENDGMSLEIKQASPTKQKIVKMAEKKVSAPSTFQSTGTGMSFEPLLKEDNTPKKQKIVKMTEKNEAPTSTFQSAGSGMSFEPRLKKSEPTMKKILKMPEKKELPPSTFQSAGSGMSFEPRVQKSTEPKKQTIVKMTEKKDSPTSTFKSTDTGMSFESRVGKPTEPAKKKILKMPEKKELPTSTFKSTDTGMSFEPRVNKVTAPKKQTIVKMAEKKDSPPSTFQSAESGMSFEPRIKPNAPDVSERKVVVASGSTLFQQGTKRVTFETDGPQFVYESPKEKRLFLAQKVASQMFMPQAKSPATFEMDDTGMNAVATVKRVTKPSIAATAKTVSSPFNPADVTPSPGLPKNVDSGGMKMSSLASSTISTRSPSTFGNIQRSKFDVNSAKKTAEDIQKLAKFVSDGLQMVYAESQQKKAVVTPAEAMRQRKERNRKKVFGFEIGPTEEELARKMMEEGTHLAVEGGKQFAKFASDGLQLVYHAAEKQTKEYIASQQSASRKKESQHVVDKTPFFATTNVDNVTTPRAKQNTVVGNESPKPYFATAQEDRTQRVETKTQSTSSDESSTSKMFRSGGRMFAKFFGDGLQLVQRAAKPKETRYRRPRK